MSSEELFWSFHPNLVISSNYCWTMKHGKVNYLSYQGILYFSNLENRLIDGDLRRDALALQRSGDWDDAGPQLAAAIGGDTGGATTANSQVFLN